MTDKVNLEVVTPRGRALSVVADEVTLPSVYGELGVLPGHVPLVLALRAGIASYRVGNDVHRSAVGPGFAEAGPDKVAVLTEQYAERTQIDPVVIRRDLARVQEELGKLEAVPLASTEAQGADAAAVDA